MPLTPTTLDPSAKSSRIALAGDELTVTVASVGYSLVRSKHSVTSGKWYVEASRTHPHLMPGIAPSGASLDTYPGASGAGIGVYTVDIYSNNAVAGAMATSVSGAYGIRIDADARTVVFVAPDGSASRPLNIYWGGAIHVVVGNGSGSATTGSIVANFGATPFTHAVPSGYVAGFGASTTYAVAGNVKDAAGDNTARVVRLYRRSDGAYIGSTTSDPVTGNYAFQSFYGGEVQRIVLDDDAGTLYNDLIDRVMLA